VAGRAALFDSTHRKRSVEKVLLTSTIASSPKANEAISDIERQRDRHVASLLAMAFGGFFDKPQAFGHPH
jgi:hypothetical protein